MVPFSNTSVCPPQKKKSFALLSMCLTSNCGKKAFYLIHLPSLVPSPEFAFDIVLIYNLHVVSVHSSQRIVLRCIKTIIGISSVVQLYLMELSDNTDR